MRPYLLAVSCLAGLLLAGPGRAQVKEAVRADDGKADPARFVHLTDITMTPTGAQAHLYNAADNKSTRLRLAEGSDTFQVKDAEGKVSVSGRVVHLEERDVVFRAGGQYYNLHIGGSIADALLKPLSKERVKELKLPPPKDRATEIQQLKAELRAMSLRLKEIEKRVTELEKQKPD
jgi:hypothetical protein